MITGINPSEERMGVEEWLDHKSVFLYQVEQRPVFSLPGGGTCAFPKMPLAFLSMSLPRN